MKASSTYNGITWIDLHQPTSEELGDIIDLYDIPSDTAEELSSDTSRSQVQLHENFIFCIFHFPVFQHTHRQGHTEQELNIILTPSTVITSHVDTIDAIHKFSKMMETQTILERGKPIDSSTTLFFAVLKKMYKSVYHELEYIEDWIDAVEEKIFQHKEREMVESISVISRRLLDMKKTLHLHDELLQSLKKAGQEFFEDPALFDEHADALINEYHRIDEKIDVHIALTDDLRNTNDSLLSTKQNETMNRLTFVAFMTLPLTVVAGLFSMNSVATPLVGHPYDFWVIIGIMVALALLLYAGFKSKGWL